jgi:hypothetical protein
VIALETNLGLNTVSVYLRTTAMDIRLQRRMLNALVIFTSLFGFLEWGGNNEAFLYETEIEVISRMLKDPLAVIHPLTLLPMAGQALLLITLFQHDPSQRLTYWGVTGLGLLIALMFVIGLISLSLKIVASTTPFLIMAFLALYSIKIQKHLASQHSSSEV